MPESWQNDIIHECQMHCRLNVEHLCLVCEKFDRNISLQDASILSFSWKILAIANKSFRADYDKQQLAQAKAQEAEGTKPSWLLHSWKNGPAYYEHTRSAIPGCNGLARWPSPPLSGKVS